MHPKTRKFHGASTRVRSTSLSNCSSKLPKHPNPENPQYCATSFLFAPTLTKEEQALLTPLAACYPSDISGTTRASQSNIDTQPADNRSGVAVESHAKDQEDPYFGGPEHCHITSAQQIFCTCQKTSTFSAVLGYELKLLTIGSLNIMSQSLSGTAANLTCDTEKGLAQTSPEKATDRKYENSSGEITGDLEHDLRIQGQSPYKLWEYAV